MNSKERHELRYQRRVAKREEKRKQALEGVDTLELLFDFDNLIISFKRCKKGVSWKHSVQYYGIHLFENIYNVIYPEIFPSPVIKEPNNIQTGNINLNKYFSVT